MVRAAFSIIAESGDPGEQFIGNIVGVMPATYGHAVAVHARLGEAESKTRLVSMGVRQGNQLVRNSGNWLKK
ncbi:MAG: hypothetical protein CMJ20_02930 [Phycisphaeraceae bacterium]|nr:hypothetical protein [Phycisphaeraceae bacterium]